MVKIFLLHKHANPTLSFPVHEDEVVTKLESDKLF